jgi:prolipoprotein diacylglyceryl transferase
MTGSAKVHAVIATIPSPGSNAISIGPLQLRAYGLMIALGIVAAVWLMGRRLEQAGIGTRDDASYIGVWGAVGGIIGARLYHVITDWSAFSGDLGKIPRLWEGGLGIPGGLALGTATGLWAARRRGVPLGGALNAAAPAIPLAQAIGRLGNWFNQELFGRPTDLPWALEVDPDKAVAAGYPPGTTFHPTFLYEALGNLALCGLLLFIDKRFTIRPGRLMVIYVAGYSGLRFFVENLRIDRARTFGSLRLNAWVSLAVFVAATGFLVIDYFRHRADEPATATDTVAVPAADIDSGPDELSLEEPGPDDTESDTERAPVDGGTPDVS